VIVAERDAAPRTGARDGGDQHRTGSLLIAITRTHGSAVRSATWQMVLTVLGIGLGTAIVLAVFVVDSALRTPFSFMSATERRDVLHVQPLVNQGLDEDAARSIARLGAGTAPVVGGIAVLHDGPRSTGLYVIGSTCAIEGFIGPVGCAEQPDAEPGPPGATPLWLSQAAADALDASVGDRLDVNGWPLGAAYVAGVFGESDLAPNGGRLAAGTVPDVAELLGRPGAVSGVLVAEDREGELATRLAEIGVGRWALKATGSLEPPILLAARRALLLVGGTAVAVGLLVATSTLLMAFGRRRHTMAVLSILGTGRPTQFMGLLTEGALLGLAAGLLAVLPGFLLGQYLSNTFGARVLTGTGLDVIARFSWLLPVVAVVVGVASGAAAAAVSAWATLRQPPLEVLGQSSLVAKPGRPRYVLAPIGAAIIAVAFVLAVPFGKGMLPLPVGFGALAILPWGLALVVMGVAPAFVAVYRRWVPIRTASGLLARADLARSPMQTAGAIVMLALAIGTFAPSMNLRTFASEAIAARGDQLVGPGVLLGARKVGEQSTAVLSDEVVAEVASWEEVAAVDPILRAPLDLSVPTVVVGLDTGSELAQREMARIGLDENAVEAVSAGGVILSTLAANHLGVGVGDQVSLPIVGGTERFDVAAIADPSFVDDTGIGDAIVADSATAKRAWRARPTFAVVTPSPGNDSTTVKARVESSYGSLVSAVDSAEFATLSADTVARFLSPVITLGWAVVVAAGIGVLNLLLLGLMQRRRERALHRAMGMDTGQEYRTSLMESGVIGGLGALFGVAATLLFSLQLSVVAPVFLTTSVGWRPVPGPIVVGIVGAVIAGLFGSLAPMIEARRFDVVGLLSED